MTGHRPEPPADEHRLRDELRGVTRAFQNALHTLPLDNRLVDVARLALPDACARLDHVVTLTEAAAHTTLDEVDALRTSLEATGRLAATLPEHTRGRLEALVREQRSHCAALDAAQAYQDLTGQIIRRVTQIIRSLESDLLALAEGRPVSAAGAGEADVMRGCGPAVAGLDTAPSTQVDADDLLDSLGI
jgi:chemotaxis protein CheZ